eukprot:m.16519 g.16519  ORF g.16519 m.16519 type:complete len:364 (+) comp5717_c0_seq1:29-1120(+)
MRVVSFVVHCSLYCFNRYIRPFIMGWKDVFPTPWTPIIFITYVMLFVNMGLLVTTSKNKDGTFPYNATTVVMLTEFTKLIICLATYVYQGNSVMSWFGTFKEHNKVFLLYFIPAGLYALYNNLSYFNLQLFDPTTYTVLLQLKIPLTAIVYQFFFDLKLSWIQYFAVIILTLGCSVQTLSKSHGNTRPLYSPDEVSLTFKMMMITVQVSCSVIAGIYNEKLLKGKQDFSAPVMVQNSFMYFHSVVINMLVLLFTGKLGAAMEWDNVRDVITNHTVVGIIINNAILGVCVSLFLKYLNSILKCFASAMEIFMTAFLAWLFFHVAFTLETALASLLVSVAIVLYFQYPPVVKESAPPPEEKDVTK